MDIFISSIVVLVLSVSGYIYTVYAQTKGNNGDLKDMGSYMPASLKRVLLLLVPVITGAGLIVMLRIFYPHAGVVHNIKLISLAMILFPVAVSDYKNHTVPNKILIFALALRLVIYVVEFALSAPTAFSTLKGDVAGALIVGVFFLICLLAFKNSIGMGDIKLFAVMGLYQGIWGCLNSIFSSLVVSFVLSVVLLVTKKKSRKDAIPFGPSVFVGTVIAIAISGM